MAASGKRRFNTEGQRPERACGEQARGHREVIGIEVRDGDRTIFSAAG